MEQLLKTEITTFQEAFRPYDAPPSISITKRARGPRVDRQAEGGSDREREGERERERERERQSERERAREERETETETRRERARERVRDRERDVCKKGI